MRKETERLVRRRLQSWTPEHQSQRSTLWNLWLRVERSRVPTALDCISLPLSYTPQCSLAGAAHMFPLHSIYVRYFNKNVTSRYLTRDEKETRPLGLGRLTNKRHWAWVWSKVSFPVFLYYCVSVSAWTRTEEVPVHSCINAQEQYGGGKRWAFVFDFF